ncbi:cobalt-precorrin 5A hydrolase [Sporosalibacterium faouarense]|uniref:cobalt-precorrin 5A hydrolase n=1 Tax=Sporosalibacterium faouarense TaxID=516123 RepID=UPI00192A80C7
MKWAIVTLTKGALNQGKIIQKKIKNENQVQVEEVHIYTSTKWEGNDSYRIEGGFSDFVGRIFYKYDMILFIMASGIVVRSISKYIQHKSKDPGILVMDEGASFVISLLSGHLGRANEGAKIVASLIGAQSVITTASDVKGTMAVDTMAMKLNCEIEDFDDAKEITSLIVNDERVGIISDIRINLDLPQDIIEISSETKDRHLEDINGMIYITNKKSIEDKRVRTFNLPSVILIPKNIIIGIGCRKNIPGKKIIEAIDEALEKLNINKGSIKTISTVDIKKNESGIKEASEHFDCGLEIIDRQEISMIEDKFKTSEFVKKTIGVGAVCEPCGYISSNAGKCLLRKTAVDGITLSIWEEKING